MVFEIAREGEREKQKRESTHIRGVERLKGDPNDERRKKCLPRPSRNSANTFDTHRLQKLGWGKARQIIRRDLKPSRERGLEAFSVAQIAMSACATLENP